MNVDGDGVKDKEDSVTYCFKPDGRHYNDARTHN